MNVTTRQTAPVSSPASGGQSPDRTGRGQNVIAAAHRWPARRWILAGPVLGAMTLLLALIGGEGLGGPAAWWVWPWAVVTAAFTTLTLTSYVPAPGTGRLLNIGCSPCAAAAAVSVVVAVLAHGLAPASPLLAVVATGVAAMGARRRLTEPAVCPTGPLTGADHDLGRNSPDPG